MSSVYRITFMLPSNSVPGMLDFLASSAVFNLEITPTNAELPGGVTISRRVKKPNGLRTASLHKTLPIQGMVKKTILEIVASKGPMPNRAISEELIARGFSGGASSINNLIATKALVRTENGLALSGRVPPPTRIGRPPGPNKTTAVTGIIPRALLRELASGPKTYKELSLALRQSPATLRNRSNFRRELRRLIVNHIIEQTRPGVYQLIATTTATTGGTIGGEEDEQRHVEAL